MFFVGCTLDSSHYRHHLYLEGFHHGKRWVFLKRRSFIIAFLDSSVTYAFHGRDGGDHQFGSCQVSSLLIECPSLGCKELRVTIWRLEFFGSSLQVPTLSSLQPKDGQYSIKNTLITFRYLSEDQFDCQVGGFPIPRVDHKKVDDDDICRGFFHLSRG